METLWILVWLRTREIGIFWKLFLNQLNQLQNPVKQKYLLLPAGKKAKLQNHRMVWVERDLIDGSSSNLPAMGRDPFHQTRVLKVPSSWPWTLPGIRQPQLLWAAWARALPSSQ